MFARPESFESMDSESYQPLMGDRSADADLSAFTNVARGAAGHTPLAMKQEPTQSPMSAISIGGVGAGGPSPDLWKKRGMETSPVSVLFIPQLRVNVEADAGAPSLR